MVEGRCMKCKKNVEIQDGKERIMKNDISPDKLFEAMFEYLQEELTWTEKSYVNRAVELLRSTMSSNIAGE